MILQDKAVCSSRQQVLHIENMIIDELFYIYNISCSVRDKTLMNKLSYEENLAENLTCVPVGFTLSRPAGKPINICFLHRAQLYYFHKINHLPIISWDRGKTLCMEIPQPISI